MPAPGALGSILIAAALGAPPQLVSFATPDGGTVYADSYGSGEHAVVLVHGARFDKESWRDQAERLADAGLRALAIDLRGYGDSRGGTESASPYDGFPLDVLAAVRFLRESGATEVSVVGGSLGGWAAARAAVAADPGEIDRLVLLAASPIEHPERLPGRKLFIASRGDPGAGHIRQQFERAPEPKRLVLLEGAAHAQHIFATDQGERLMAEILRFLEAP